MDFVRQSSLRVANLLKADRWLSADHELGGEMVYEFGRITPKKRGRGRLNVAAGPPTTIVDVAGWLNRICNGEIDAN